MKLKHPTHDPKPMDALSYYLQVQREYALAREGYLRIDEADDTYNDLNRKIINAYRERYGTAYLGRIELWDQAVDQPCDGGLAASAPAAEQDALSVRNRQIDVVQAIMLLPLVGKRHMLQLNHPNTPFQYSPTARYAAKQTPARRSAGPM